MSKEKAQQVVSTFASYPPDYVFRDEDQRLLDRALEALRMSPEDFHNKRQDREGQVA